MEFDDEGNKLISNILIVCRIVEAACALVIVGAIYYDKRLQTT